MVRQRQLCSPVRNLRAELTGQQVTPAFDDLRVIQLNWVAQPKTETVAFRHWFSSSIFSTIRRFIYSSGKPALMDPSSNNALYSGFWIDAVSNRALMFAARPRASYSIAIKSASS